MNLDSVYVVPGVKLDKYATTGSALVRDYCRAARAWKIGIGLSDGRAVVAASANQAELWEKMNQAERDEADKIMGELL